MPGEGGFDPFGMPGQRREGGAAPGEQPNLPPLPPDTDPFRMDLQPPAGNAPAPDGEPGPASGAEPGSPDLSPPPAGGAGDLNLPRADAGLAPVPGEADSGPAPEAPALETSGALAPAAPAAATGVAPTIISPLAPSPDLGGLSGELLPNAPPLAPPDAAVGVDGPISLPANALPGPVSGIPGPELEPIPGPGPADVHRQQPAPPRRGILARFFKRSRQR